MPRKHMRALSGVLAGTSGSFLVSKDPVASAQRIAPPILESHIPLPTPNWSLAYPSGDGKTSLAMKSALEQRVVELEAELQLAHWRDCAHEAIGKSSNAQMVV
jgi:hypothetical protein